MDIVEPGLVILFVGLNPSPVSVAKGHYHQGRLGQQFWKLLVDYGLLPKPAPGGFHDDLLLNSHFGITDLVKVPSPRADSLDPADVAHGRKVLAEKVSNLRPKVLCSVYKKALEELCETKFRNEWGLLKQRVGESSIFILPFPYRPAEEVRVRMRQLNELVRTVGRG